MPHAIEYDAIGGPEVLEYREVDREIPGDGQVLVEVRAIGVNPIDWKIRSGRRASRPDHSSAAHRHGRRGGRHRRR